MELLIMKWSSAKCGGITLPYMEFCLDCHSKSLNSVWSTVSEKNSKDLVLNKFTVSELKTICKQFNQLSNTVG